MGSEAMEDLYQMMFKRKSFRQFKINEALTEDDLNLLRDFIEKHAVRLSESAQFDYQIVPCNETSCKRGDYSVLIYSSQDAIGLLNAGYVFAQLDLYAASMDIGTCWYGMGAPINREPLNHLPFTIMMAIGKAQPDEFRKNYQKAKRKATEELMMGDTNLDFIEYVKYTPSACNSQPWLFRGTSESVTVYMNSKEKMLIPKDKISYYNTIDLGILLCSCDQWFDKNGIQATRELNHQKELYITGDCVVLYKWEVIK